MVFGVLDIKMFDIWGQFRIFCFILHMTLHSVYTIIVLYVFQLIINVDLRFFTDKCTQLKRIY
jgi:hypothetical protein